MGKLYVPTQARTPVDRVRRALDRVERAISDVSRTDLQPLELIHLLDEIESDLRELEQQEVDVRVERTQFETIQRQLERCRGEFLTRAGQALKREREKINPDTSRWWWYLDEAAAKHRRRTFLRVALATAAVVAVLAGAWFAYREFLAPPPEVGQAYRRMETAKSLLEDGDLQAALADFDAATALTPDDPEPWLWKGALHELLGDQAQAEQAFATAEPLYPTAFGFVLNRGRIYLQTGNVEKARADVKKAIELNPDSGWGYYLRAAIAVERGDFVAGLADLKRAGELAGQNGDQRLQSMAATQRARLMQMQPLPTLE